MPYLKMRFGEMSTDPSFIFLRERQCGGDAELRKIRGGLGADAPHLFRGQLCEEFMRTMPGNGGQAVRFVPFGGDLGQDLGRRKADGEREAQFRGQCSLDLPRDVYV